MDQVKKLAPGNQGIGIISLHLLSTSICSDFTHRLAAALIKIARFSVWFGFGPKPAGPTRPSQASSGSFSGSTRDNDVDLGSDQKVEVFP